MRIVASDTKNHSVHEGYTRKFLPTGVEPADMRRSTQIPSHASQVMSSWITERIAFGDVSGRAKRPESRIMAGMWKR